MLILLAQSSPNKTCIFLILKKKGVEEGVLTKIE